jgi:hypothetical protein
MMGTMKGEMMPQRQDQGPGEAIVGGWEERVLKRIHLSPHYQRLERAGFACGL